MSAEKVEKEKIVIFGLEKGEASKDRGVFDRLQNLRYGHGQIDPDELKERLTKFLNSMESVIQGVRDEFGGFALDSVTLTVEVSAKGQVSLLGTGGELAGKGGLTFTLKRKQKS